jgi:rhodanese-related sulfurtransferase
VRSVFAEEFLMENGFQKVVNLTGGVHRWSADVDDSVPAY